MVGPTSTSKVEDFTEEDSLSQRIIDATELSRNVSGWAGDLSWSVPDRQNLNEPDSLYGTLRSLQPILSSLNVYKLDNQLRMRLSRHVEALILSLSELRSIFRRELEDGNSFRSAIKSAEVKRGHRSIRGHRFRIRPFSYHIKSAHVPLWLAIHDNDIDTARLQFQRGAVIRLDTSEFQGDSLAVDGLRHIFDDTPWEWAIANDDWSMIKLLLDTGTFRGSIKDPTKFLLRIAIDQESENLVRHLLGEGIAVGLTDVDQNNFFRRIVESSNQGIFQLLLDHKLCPTLSGQKGCSLLLFAMEDPDSRITRQLLHLGIDLESRNVNGDTPLISLTKSKNRHASKWLLEHGADVNSKDSIRQTSLSHAVRGKNVELVKLLLEYGADPNSRDRERQTPLSHAARDNSVDIAKLLLEKNATCDAADLERNMALYKAISSNSVDVVNLLLDSGVEVETRNSKGETLLDLAFKYNKVDVAKLLLQRGANLDVKDHHDQTLLFLAISQGSINAVDLLLSCGASLESRNYKGRTPLFLAIEARHLNVINLLLNRGASLDARDINDYTPLTLAVLTCREDSVELLLDRGADIEARDYQGQTPLLFAVHLNHAGITKLLVERGARLDVKDDAGHTPLSWAEQKARTDIIKLLRRVLADRQSTDAKNQNSDTMNRQGDASSRDSTVSNTVAHSEPGSALSGAEDPSLQPVRNQQELVDVSPTLSITTEAQINRHRQYRVIWTSPGGFRGVDIFTEFRPGAIQEYIESINNDGVASKVEAVDTAHPALEMLTSIALSAGITINNVLATFKITVSKIFKSSSTSTGTTEATSETIPEATQQENTIRIRQDFLLLCINRSNYFICREDLNVTGIEFDRQLFSDIQRKYMSSRSHMVHFLSVMSVQRITFVKFALREKNEVDCLEPDNLPPVSAVHYEFEPRDPGRVPPIGSTFLLRRFTTPDECGNSSFCLRQFPKRIEQQPELGKPPDEDTAWGIHIQEGFNVEKVVTFAFLGFFISLVFGIVWAVRYSLVDGFQIAAYVIASWTLGIATLQYAISKV